MTFRYTPDLYKELYRHEHNGVLVRVALCSGKPILILNDMDNHIGVLADIPREEISKLGNALLKAWEGEQK